MYIHGIGGNGLFFKYHNKAFYDASAFKEMLNSAVWPVNKEPRNSQKSGDAARSFLG